MKELPNISDAEWNVMKVLWEKSPRSSAEIVNELKDKYVWSPKTVQTLITRLVKKDAISLNKDGTCYLYSTAVAQDDLVRKETKNFISRVFNGSQNAFITHFIKDVQFSEKELDELRKILNKD